MSSHYKAFIVVIVLTTIAFWLARPVFINFMPEEDFVRRRNLWLALTSFGFLVPNFWLFMAIAAVLLWRAAQKDPNPAALWFFLLMVVPAYQQPVPGFGLFNFAFALDHFRLLSLALALPAVLRLRKEAARFSGQGQRSAWLAPDLFLVAYALLPIVMALPGAPVTVILRGLFGIAVDLFLPYYLISRSCVSKKHIVEAIAAFALSAMVLAPLAVFESGTGWLLFANMSDYWSISTDSFGYLMRGTTLRAQATSAQSIVLGNFFAVVLGLWLYLQLRLTGWRRWLGTLAVVVGLFVALSRGPWVGAVVCTLAFFAARPNAMTGLLKVTAVSVVVGAVAIASPWGNALVDLVPFVGTVDADSITYRQEMIRRSWQLIEQNPLFGNPDFMSYLEDMRTGYGMIDLLNAYLTIGMASGLVTLGAFLLFFATASLRCLRTSRILAVTDPDTSMLGAALLASLIGTLVIIYTVSNVLSIPYIYVGITALMVAYSRVPHLTADVQAQAHLGPQGPAPAGVSNWAGRYSKRGPTGWSGTGPARPE